MITTILPNGLTLMSYQFTDPNDNVSIIFHVDVGARDDKIPGTSHFVEHMLFEGTNSRTHKDIVVLYRKLHGSQDAYTCDVKTQYTITTNYPNLETAIDLFSDIMQNSIFDKKRIEIERQAVKCEMSRYCDDMQRQLSDLFLEGIGKEDVFHDKAQLDALKDINRDVLLNHYKQYYVPNNTTIFVSGKFDQEKLESIVKEKTKDWIAHDVGERRPAPEQFHGDFRKKLDMKQCYFDIGFKGEKKEATKDYFTWRVGINLLNNDYFFDATRKEAGLNYEISNWFFSNQYYGCWGIKSNTDCESVNDLLHVIGGTLFSIIANITEEDIEKAKNNLKEMWTTEPKSLLECNANMEIDKYFKCSDEDAVKIIDRVTLDDVRKWFEVKLKSDDIVVAALGDIDEMYSYNEIVGKIHGAANEVFPEVT